MSVLITLLFKKIISPEQDIRLHQKGMENGFSARVLDTKIITPFLKENSFPYMISGAGALTRSLEQAVPYNLQYTGAIKPKVIKSAFLNCVDAIQNKNINIKEILIFTLKELIFYRDRDSNLKLTKPKNLSIKDIVSKVNQHFKNSTDSRLPVLAIYAVYKQIIIEFKKYKNCTLCDLQPHNASDKQSRFLGDTQINDEDGLPLEAVEIKHNISLTPDLVETCFNKFKTTTIKTYYLLSTKEEIESINEISKILKDIYKNHGCQMIVNGIQTTLKYYLRLIYNTDNFIYNYVELIEKECNYSTKIKWEELWGT